MKRKKFSQFELPSVLPSEIYLVGYEVGTGENGENTSVRIKASDLAFSVTGAAGVSSFNGLSGAVNIDVGEGLSITNSGNTLTLSNTSQGSNLTVDQTFDPQSSNPQSGTAINQQLANFATLTGANNFTGETQTQALNVQGKLRVNGVTAFNNTVTVQGQNLGLHMDNCTAHNSDTSLHWQETDRTNFNNLASNVETLTTTNNTHISDTSLHWQESDRETITDLIDHSEDEVVHLTALERNFLFGENAFSSFSTYDAEIYNTDNATILAVDLSRNHFTTGLISTISVPKNRASDYTGYMAVQIFYEGDADNADKTGQTFYSDNKVVATGNTTAEFHFSNLILPEEYKFVRLCLVEDKTQVPEVTTKANCIPWRMMPLKRIHDNSLVFDTDECRCWQETTLGASAKNWLAYVNVTKADHRTDVKQIQSSLWVVNYPSCDALESIKTTLTEQELTYHSFTQNLSIDGTETTLETLYLTFEGVHTARELQNLWFSSLTKSGVFPTYHPLVSF